VCGRDLAHAVEPPGAVLTVEAHDVFSGVSDEGSLRDDGVALRLTSVQDEAHTLRPLVQETVMAQA
jgi:hypothetical protein